MALQAITLSIDPVRSCDPAKTPGSNAACAFCGVAAGRWAGHGYFPAGFQSSVTACALCSLPQHLERPRIDEEAVLVWLPEISQPALNVTMREIHVALQALGEDVHADAVFRTRPPALSNLYYARAVLADRRGAAEARAGTASPRELGMALLELSPAAYRRRGELLDGLRLLPLGRFFEGELDVYPEIVGFWRKRAKVTPTRLNGAR
jgi:intracellular multiplication protein IcmJ